MSKVKHLEIKIYKKWYAGLTEAEALVFYFQFISFVPYALSLSVLRIIYTFHFKQQTSKNIEQPWKDGLDFFIPSQVQWWISYILMLVLGLCGQWFFDYSLQRGAQWAECFWSICTSELLVLYVWVRRQSIELKSSASYRRNWTCISHALSSALTFQDFEQKRGTNHWHWFCDAQSDSHALRMPAE